MSLRMTVINCSSELEMNAVANVLIAAIADQFSTIDTTNFEVVSISCNSRRWRNRYLSSRSISFDYRFSLPNEEARVRGETANTWQGYLNALDDDGQVASLASAIVTYASQNVNVATQDETSIKSSVSVMDVLIVSDCCTDTSRTDDSGDDMTIIYASIGAGLVVILIVVFFYFKCASKRNPPIDAKTTEDPDIHAL